MAKMTTCKTCKKEVASSDQICPSCGARLKMVIEKKILIGLVGLIIIFGIIAITYNRNDTSAMSDMTEPIDQYKADCQQIGYIDLARNPNKYIDNKVKFTGEVVQVSESGKNVAIRMNVTKNEYGSYVDTIWVDYTKASENESRILENDIVDIWGTVKGLKKYSSVMGAEITAPEIAAREIKLSSSTTSGYTSAPTSTSTSTSTSTFSTPTSSASNLQTNGEKTVNSTSSKHYINARFGFSIDYPSTYSDQTELQNGDGMTVRTSDGIQ